MRVGWQGLGGVAGSRLGHRVLEGCKGIGGVAIFEFIYEPQKYR